MSIIKAANKKRKSPLITQLSRETINLAANIYKFHSTQANKSVYDKTEQDYSK